MTTFNIDIINSSLVNKDITGLPPGTTHNIASFEVYSGSFFKKEYCLNLKSVNEEDPGELFLIQKKKNCEDTLIEGKKVFKEKFYNLRVNINEKKIDIKLDTNHIEIPLINKKKLITKKFASHIKTSEYGSFEISTNLGGEKLHELVDGEICFETDDECNVVKDNCDQCPYGTYYIKNNACEKSYTKVCGIDRCGERLQYACIRGPSASGVKDYCIPDSPYGFCQPGLRVNCINKILICE